LEELGETTIIRLMDVGVWMVTPSSSDICEEIEGVETLESSTDVIERLGLTRNEVGVARKAAKLIRDYRGRRKGTWSGPTADTLVRSEVGDISRQIGILSLACLMERESREEDS
jgi:hypothetical protein